MSSAKQSKYMLLAIAICFIIPAIVQILAPIFFEADFSGQYPVYSKEIVLALEFLMSFELIGLTILGMKAEEDRSILAAAGFTSLAISLGLAGAALFEIAFVVNLEAYEKFYYITLTSNFLYFPSLLLIATYEKFKVWIRIAGLVASLPLLLSTVLFISGYRDFIVLESISSIGYMLFMVITLLWVWNLYKNDKSSANQEA